jgi:uncharacterized membrane protein YqjE
LRRASAAISIVLLAFLTVAIAGASLAALLILFSYVLKIQVRLILGSTGVVFAPVPYGGPSVDIFGPAAIASMIFFFASGLVTAAWRYRRWRPSP